ncbi:sensor histidine kinase [Scytonema hofmannii]|nr:ATP-binding protein [Scytonema hofmannii]
MTVTQNTRLPSKNSSIYNLFKRFLSHLSISQKIGYGYALALSVAIVGTIAGITIGEYYHRQAQEKHDHAIQEIELLSRLQNAILQTRTHQQQFIPLIQNSKLLQEEHFHFLEHTTEINQLLSKITSYVSRTSYQREKHTDGIPDLLETYKGVPEEYWEQIEKLMGQLQMSSFKLEEMTTAQQVLLNFTNSPIALKFDSFSDDLTEVIQASYRDRTQAEKNVLLAERLRLQLIIGSILFSTALAAILAFYTSSAIAHPLTTVTNVAQRVTQESNFDLQTPVTTTDEVGKLAISLNLLIQQVKQLLKEQQAEAQAQLVQSEKLSSLGRMIAGVAHEINNPVSFISANLVHAKTYIDDLLALLQAYQEEVPNPSADTQVLAQTIDLEFLKDDLPKLLNSIEFGAIRTREIAGSLKDFARLDGSDAQPVNIHPCIDSTLSILNSRLKQNIKVVRNYGDIFAIAGYMGLLYQVFMNLLSNAIDTLEEKLAVNSQFQPEITITTEIYEQNWILVRIADNGLGIPLENQSKIFETFFTTKPRGVGTGLGLAITHQIVVEKHGGKITCKSELDKGTEFTISLPIHSQ